jgi:hypothetical protein
MAMSADRFAERLVAEVPEAEAVVAEHLEDNDELLLHVLMYNLVQLCEAAWAAANHDVLRRCLALLNDALLDGDEYVKNAVAVSFVEDSCWYEPANQEYIATWPPALQAEVESQRAWWAARAQD